MKKNLYDEVTNKIIAQLEKGVVPWVKPWSDAKARKIAGVGGKRGNIMPHNYASGRPYSGVNVLILWDAQMTGGYATAEWLTYKQATELGGHVRKGEKSSVIYFLGQGTKENENGEEKRYSYLKSFNVFNVAQCEGLKAKGSKTVEDETTEDTPLNDDEFERFISATRAKLNKGVDRAYYSPGQDAITMPPVGAFRSREDYKATLLHELTHWTGHKSRLARDFSGRFGTEAYAAEELVAEMGAAFLCASLGVEGKLQHPEYIASWLKVMKGDNRAIFTAASKASKAADLVLSTAPERAKATGTALVVYRPQLPMVIAA